MRAAGVVDAGEGVEQELDLRKGGPLVRLRGASSSSLRPPFPPDRRVVKTMPLPVKSRSATHGPSVRLLIVSTATSVRPDGESCWSQGSIPCHLRERSLAVSRSTEGRVLAEARIRPHKVRGWLNCAYDPAFWARPARSAVSICTPSPAPHDRNRA